MAPPKPQPWYTSLNPTPRSPAYGRNRKPSPPAHRDPTPRADSSPGADDTADAIDYASLSLPNWTYRTFARPEPPKPPPIPHAGIRAGEIIGHRMWSVLEGHHLCSLAHFYIWQPGAVIEGNIDEEVSMGLILFGRAQIMGGVYSFANLEQLTPEFAHIKDADFPCIISFGYKIVPVIGVAIGTIRC